MSRLRLTSTCKTHYIERGDVAEARDGVCVRVGAFPISFNFQMKLRRKKLENPINVPTRSSPFNHHKYSWGILKYLINRLFSLWSQYHVISCCISKLMRIIYGYMLCWVVMKLHMYGSGAIKMTPTIWLLFGCVFYHFLAVQTTYQENLWRSFQQPSM